MSKDENKYRLKRSDLDEKTIKKLITEVNFVCPARDANGPCNDIFLTWHHFDPPFKDCREHNPEGIIALCQNHHNRADAGEYSISELREWKQNPNIRDLSDIKTKVSFLDRTDLHVNIGNTFLMNNMARITCGDALIDVRVSNNNIVTFNLKITDVNGEHIFHLKDNVFSPTTKNVSIRAKPRSLRINVKGKKTNFQIYGKRIGTKDYEATLQEQAREFISRSNKSFEQWWNRRQEFLEQFPRLNRFSNSFDMENLRPTLDIDDIITQYKNRIRPDSLLVFLKGKIYFQNGYADLDNAFTSSDGSTIQTGPFAEPVIEIGHNFVAAKNL